MNKNNVDYHQMDRTRLVKANNKLVKTKIRRLAFTSLSPFHLMIINITFVNTSLYVMVQQVGKICVLDLPMQSSGCAMGLKM